MRIRDTDKQDLVKEKAVEMLVSDGLEGFSVNKLAKACGISVATLYIYYKDKDDLITSIALEESRRMTDATLQNFTPDMHFAEGLRRQWENRLAFMLDNRKSMLFFEQIRSSTYFDKVFASVTQSFKEVLGKFTENAVTNGEINRLPLEVYWSVAFAPLYALVRFHHEGTSLGGKTFAITDDVVWQTFDLVLKALKP